MTTPSGRVIRMRVEKFVPMLDELEEEGIVGPQLESAKSRDVIIN